MFISDYAIWNKTEKDNERVCKEKLVSQVTRFYYFSHSYNNNNNKINNKKYMIECVPNYTSTYARKQGYNWTKYSGMNMYQNQLKQVKGVG